jgi:hypothetical protein
MATYVNDLRLKEIATGDESGSWGNSTNTNLELIGEALGFGTEAITTNADTHTTTVADGSTDPGRAMYIKYTGTLDSACTITIAPNTMSRMHFIENGTSGSQNIIISQGTGANVTIPAGDVKAVYLDGAGSGAAVADAFASLNTVDLKVEDDLTVTDDATIGGTLGVTGIVTLTDDLIIGDGKTIGSASDVDAMTIASNGQVTFSQTLIGTALDISGDVDVDGTTETDALTINGSALKYKAFGTGSIMFGDDATGTISSADSNTGVGVDVFAAITSGDNNTAVGNAAMTAITSGSKNVAVGTGALDAASTSDDNTAVGYNAMTANTSGTDNVAVGQAALDANTEGDLNTAVGSFALSTATTANNNTGLGYSALFLLETGSNNTAVGRGTGQLLTTGTQNVFVGAESGDAATTASNNTGVGYESLGKLTTGTDNVAVGRAAGLDNTTGTGNTSIGVEALENQSGGNNCVGVGKQAGRSVTSGTNNMLLGPSAGNSGSPGGAITSGNNEVTLGNGDHSKINAQVSITVASDERDKTDFQPLSAGLDFVNQLTPYTYYWDKRHKYVDWETNPDADLNSITHDGTHKEDWLDVGFKAQDVVALEQSINHNLSDKTNLTTSLSDDGKQYALQYEKFVPILVKAVQELTAKIETLEDQLNGE